MSEPIEVAPGVRVPSDALEVRAVRAGGPGGQNVNKVSSKIELHVALGRIEGLTPDARGRLRALCAGRLDAEGRLLVTSQKTRDRPKNLDDARHKVRALIAQALIRPARRQPTRPTRASVERRLEDKQRRARKRRQRRIDD
jgi:ribosome-associated protein